ncbi:uncharacterized protein [Argopecten irradians]|uniref:uncharacterized protein n=1 Tax=Argopecten irradians TaxID=31199 RepID=UPI0037133BCC
MHAILLVAGLWLLITDVELGSAQEDAVCNSYRAIQRLYCLEIRQPTPSEAEKLFGNGYFTREGLAVFLHIWCSSLLQYEQCIADNTYHCMNQVELRQLHQQNGGLCTAGGQIDPQVTPFLQRFQRRAISGECAEFWNSAFDSCYPLGSSETPDRPNPSLGISEGIEWWTARRRETIQCIVQMATPAVPENCEGTVTDAKIFAIFDNLWSEPYGIGAHVNISEFLDQI